MKESLPIICAILLLLSCGKKSNIVNSIPVKNIQELNEAIDNATPGTEIVLANGVWKDAQINFYGMGTEKAPIVLRAETPGEVIIQGKSFLHLGGEYLIADGLYFRDGFTPKRAVFRYQIGKDSTAFHSKISNCVIEDFTQPNRWNRDVWVGFYGRHNKLEHCYLSGKSNKGATVMVFQKGNQHINNHHQIVNNYFGPRPRKGGPSAETMRIGGSETSMTPGRVNVSNNYFEACNGEVEIISDKTAYNSFTNNIFDKCEGSLVMRHSDYTTVDANIFIGDDDSDFYGGIRVVNTGHWITNNYFYKIRGEEFRSPLAIMNGIPKSALNRYKQVTDAVIAHNTWVDCKSPFQIGVGQNKASKDVLPKSEIRSAPPIRTIIANNLVYNTEIDESPVVNHDNIKGVSFERNIIDNNGSTYSEYDAFHNANVEMKAINDWLFVPESGQAVVLDSVFNGFDFDKIEKDLFGTIRGEKSRVGAVQNLAGAEGFKIDKKKYGPSWFSVEKIAIEPNILTAAAGELAKVIADAKSGDIIELNDELYDIRVSLKIDKEITLRSKGKNKAQLVFSGAENTPAFAMHPKGRINLENISVKGQNTQLAFAPLNENMSSAYNLFLDNCVIEDFTYILKASKGSFADSINVRKTTFQNCENGFVLAADEKGNYNAEMVDFTACKFTNIKQNVIHFYRGGYDESTIGGYLTLSSNTFTNCGQKEKSGVLLKTRGIINVLISENTFKNNPVTFVAVLWGAKNNHHRNNTIAQSGQMKVEEQQKLDLLY